MAEVEIYSATVCPYAHRTRLTLLEKGVDFKLTEIDLHNKPEWFADVSPYGKVPVIKHGSDRDSVQGIKHTADFYIEQYIQYANNTASGITAQEMRQN